MVWTCICGPNDYAYFQRQLDRKRTGIAILRGTTKPKKYPLYLLSPEDTHIHDKGFDPATLITSPEQPRYGREMSPFGMAMMMRIWVNNQTKGNT